MDNVDKNISAIIIGLVILILVILLYIKFWWVVGVLICVGIAWTLGRMIQLIYESRKKD